MIQKTDQPSTSSSAGSPTRPGPTAGTCGTQASVAFSAEALKQCPQSFRDARDVVSAETGVALGEVSPDQAAALVNALAGARQVVVVGAGRSKLAIEAFAMRLAHMGVPTSVYSDVTAPPVGQGDLVVACSGSGETSGVVQLATSAVEAGAGLAAVVGEPDSTLGRRADMLVVLREYSRGRAPGRSEQFIGTLFEQTALLFFDSVVLALERAGAVHDEDMRRRHTNME
ncbi:6-phospho-3-hexuloisomerase [Streptomyces sp. NPDC007088]|uniref:6-phospho-3-hexuloisomerase n=1 Tax=Streptomyces sp. NPDC007088 TaxID=3364773 RepID=UPI00368D5782